MRRVLRLWAPSTSVRLHRRPQIAAGELIRSAGGLTRPAGCALGHPLLPRDAPLSLSLSVSDSDDATGGRRTPSGLMRAEVSMVSSSTAAAICLASFLPLELHVPSAITSSLSDCEQTRRPIFQGTRMKSPLNCIAAGAGRRWRRWNRRAVAVLTVRMIFGSSVSVATKGPLASGGSAASHTSSPPVRCTLRGDSLRTCSAGRVVSSVAERQSATSVGLVRHAPWRTRT